jgi:hypothetical protein
MLALFEIFSVVAVAILILFLASYLTSALLYLMKVKYI